MKRDKEVQVKIKKIRKRMQEVGIDAWIVLSSDFHESEYLCDYFKCREYLSGFTGSAGSLVVLPEEAGLWTDGRYFLQAEKELDGSGILLYRKGEENVPELEEYIVQKVPEHALVGVDGRTISVNAYRRLEKKLEKKQAAICLEYDLTGDIWEDRPAMSCRPAWELDLCYAGNTRKDKIAKLREKLKEEGAEGTVISSLDDIAWTLNIRGSDIACSPVVLSYLMITQNCAIWFVQKHAVHRQLEERLKLDGVALREYEDIYSYLSEKSDSYLLYLDPDRTNMFLFKSAQESRQVGKRKILEGKNVTLLPKAVKNPTEIENMRKAHRKDAVACIKFIYWLKKHFNGTVQREQKDRNPGMEALAQPGGEEGIAAERNQITEMTAAEKLEEFRRGQEHYLGASFNTIVGYAQHGAIVHYSASPDTDLPLRTENLVLIDSGGHYLEGTTDITRTIALGTLTREQKHYYTLVLKGNLNLAAAKFRYGCTGISLDCLARKALWNEGMDYNHGTGHGVGYLLSVHEPPNCFRSTVSESGEECMKLEPGMITSNEPGLYLAGRFGIRLENLLLCREVEKTEFGRFLGFETLTLVPFERDAILTEELEEWEREWINQYHAKIVDKVGGYLDEEEFVWLKEAAAAI